MSKASMPQEMGLATSRPHQARLISIITVLVLFGLWWTITTLGLVKPLFLPAPEAVAQQFWQYATGAANDQPLSRHLFASVGRVLLAFSLAVVTAVPLGILMGLSPLARGVFDPVLEFYRPLPPLAYLPLIIIWCGIDEFPKILLIYLGCFAPLALAARSGIRTATLEQMHAASSMGASRWQVVRHVLLPAALPEVLVGMRIAIGMGWTTLVAAEMVAAQVGLGQMVLNASNFLRSDIVVMGILLIGGIAWSFDTLLRRLETRLTPWRGRS